MEYPAAEPYSIAVQSQVGVRYALEGVIGEIGQTTIERGLRRGSTLTEIAAANFLDTENMLHAIYLQIKFATPWSLCIHLEAAPKKEILILDPCDLVQLIPRSFTKGQLERHMGSKYDAKMQLRTKKPGLPFTQDTVLSEYFGNSQDLPILLYSMISN